MQKINNPLARLLESYHQKTKIDKEQIFIFILNYILFNNQILNIQSILNRIKLFNSHIFNVDKKKILKQFIKNLDLFNCDDFLKKLKNYTKELNINKLSFIISNLYHSCLLKSNKYKKGIQFTNEYLSLIMTDKILSSYNKKDLPQLKIIDPACGFGNLLIDSFIKKLNILDNHRIDLAFNTIYGIEKEYLAYYGTKIIFLCILKHYKPNINESFEELFYKLNIYHTNDSISAILLNQLDNNGIIGNNFDVVITNPPYISYNESSKLDMEIINLIKNKKASLANIFGVNLHSTPSEQKKYRPNPNLFSFFIALSLYLLKENALLIALIPQTFLNAGDLDVLRYELAFKHKILNIDLFDKAQFYDTNTRNDKILTSSLIISLNKTMENNIDISINDKELNINILKKHIRSWNFICKEKKDIDIYNEYLKNSQDIDIYYNHEKSKEIFNSSFYFDSGYDINEKLILKTKPRENALIYPKLNNHFFYITDILGYWKDSRDKDDKYYIKLRQANQKYNLLDSKYKIIWSYINPDRFYFTDKSVIWARNRYCSIASNNKDELLYLFALLNSEINKNQINLHLKINNEKNLLLSTKKHKNFYKSTKTYK